MRYPFRLAIVELLCNAAGLRSRAPLQGGNRGGNCMRLMVLTVMGLIGGLGLVAAIVALPVMAEKGPLRTTLVAHLGSAQEEEVPGGGDPDGDDYHGYYNDYHRHNYCHHGYYGYDHGHYGYNHGYYDANHRHNYFHHRRDGCATNRDDHHRR